MSAVEWGLTPPGWRLPLESWMTVMDTLPTLPIDPSAPVDEHKPALRRPAARKEKSADAGHHKSEAHATGRSESTGSGDSLMREMLEELRSIRRLRQHHDFSMAHLIGSIMQAFAVCALVWAFYAAISDYKMAYMDASLRVLFAMVFQLMALTGFLIGGRR